MRHADFRIGLEFIGTAGFRWRCTDVGTRAIIAVQLDHDDPNWYQGPPYIAREVVFDEAEMAGCYLTELELLEDRLAKAAKSAHPNFSSEDFFRMNEERTEEGPRYPNRGVLRFDRLREDGEILHPYSARCDQDGEWFVRVLLLFPRTYAEIREREFIALPRATEEDMRVRAKKS